MRDAVPMLARGMSVENVKGADYEVQHIRFPYTAGRNAVRRLFTDEAEYGGWELVRVRRYRDGTRDAWLRRRIIRARATLVS